MMSCSILERTTTKNGGTASCRSAVSLCLEENGSGIGEDGKWTRRKKKRDFEEDGKGTRRKKKRDLEEEKIGNRESCNSIAVFS